MKKIRLPYQLIVVVALLWMPILKLCGQDLIPTSRYDMRLPLDGVWQFKLIDGAVLDGDSLFKSPAYDASDWEGIRVPGNWEMQGYAGLAYGKDIKAGYGLYRQAFELDRRWSTNLIYIAFDGVENGFTFYINAKEVGTFPSAHNRCMFDISKYMNYEGKNMIAVKVPRTGSRGYQFDLNDDWSLGGISRSVTLYAIPVTHFEDITIRTKLIDRQTAHIELDFAKFAIKKNVDVTIGARLLDANGEVVAAFEGLTSDKTMMEVKNYHPWTAETPYLYSLMTELKENGRTVQVNEQKVGIRDISWQNAVLRINGQAVKLRGVNHHDESPMKGRAITEQEIKKDLEMMKEANINTIRTSHYPPNERLIELCDSMGIYVICEVPFGYGDELLSMSGSLELLKQRAKMTVERDKNHPSVIIWSVGNENPVTENGLKTGAYVQELDPTRPYVFPSTHKPFEELRAMKIDSIPLYSCHYPTTEELKKWGPTLDKPLVNTEFAHALGNDFGQMEDIVEEWYRHDKLAGGAVWLWADQGLMRMSMDYCDKTKTTQHAWIDRSLYYDANGDKGTDGIVYADRTPQTDYWQVRKVYSPVKITKAGEENEHIIIKVFNRYDFTDLKDVKTTLEMYCGKQKLSETSIDLNCAPHDSTMFKISIPQNLPQGGYCYYLFKISNQKGQQFYEKTIRIGKENLQIDQFCDGNTTNITQSSSTLEDFILQNVMVRVGRKPTICQEATMNGNQGKRHSLWKNYLLRCSDVKVKKEDKNHFVADCTFNSDDGNNVSGTLLLEKLENNALHINYQFTARGTGEALETGLAIKTSLTEADMRWAGKGPYAAYPGKEALSEYGVWQLNSNDLYFAGNRRETEVMTLTNKKGEGYAIVPDQPNDISVERYNDGIVLSHNASMASPFNKNIWPKGTVNLDGRQITGAFTLCSLSGIWSDELTQLLGNQTDVAKPFKPLYHYYDY